MAYHLDFLDKAKKDIDFFKTTGNKIVLKKLLILLKELAEHPFDGLGKPEQLKYSLGGFWSRRINYEYRLVYEVFEDKILIHSTRGHYE
jgi:toxin YoeB